MMTMVNRPCMASMDCITCRSDSESSALVASSRISSRLFPISARARASRCRCPPEMRKPRSPMMVS